MIWFTICWCAKFASYWISRCLGRKPVTDGLVKICVVSHNVKHSVGAQLSVTCHRSKRYPDIMHNEACVIINAERNGDPIWPVDIRVFVPTGCDDAEITCEVPTLRKEAELRVDGVHAGWNNYTLFLKDKSND